MDVLFLSISSNVGITCPGGSSEALATCSVAYEVIVTVGSLIVSGSVVVVGNI